MAEYIRYKITNTEPLRIADDNTSQSGQTTTLRYIPGTTVRGFVINQLAGQEDFEKIKKELFSERVKYLNAYPRREEKELIPAPKGFYEGKVPHEVDGKIEIENVVVNGNFPEGFKRASLGRYCYLEKDCIYGYPVHTQTDMKIRIYEEADGKRTVFHNEYMESGNCFTGYISVEDRALGERIRKLFDGKILLGNARSSGYGKCQVMACDWIESLPYEKYLPKKAQEGECYLMLLSNTVMRNDRGELCGFSEEMVKKLEEKLGVRHLKIAFCSTSTVRICGYNRTWGTKLPSMMAYEQGSVFHLKYDGSVTVEKIRELTDEGLGIRKNEGFGRILFLDEYEAVKYKVIEDSGEEKIPVREKTEFTKEDRKVLKIAARTYYKKILERKRAEYIISGDGRKELWNERTSKSQLGALDSLITAYRYDPKRALSEVRTYIRHANEKEQNNRTQKTHNSLLDAERYIEKLFGKPLEETLPLSGEKSETLMGIPKSEILSEEEEMGMKLDLIVDLIRMKNKEAK